MIPQTISKGGEVSFTMCSFEHSSMPLVLKQPNRVSEARHTNSRFLYLSDLYQRNKWYCPETRNE
jgi:hypothetical protein